MAQDAPRSQGSTAPSAMSIATPNAQAPPTGPLCSHQEPTVLADVNGRKMYRCSRYPKNHCNVCCPLEVALVPLRPAAGTPHASAARQQQQQQRPPPQQQQRLCSTASMGAAGSPLSPVAGGSSQVAAEEEGKTPSQEHRPPRLPDAPSKSSSIDSRQQPEERAAAQRSLDFNVFAIQAIRARQLGAQYMVMRPSARQVARMQQLAAVTPAAAGPRSAKDAGRKRGRDPPSPLERHPLAELTLGGGSGQKQLVQRRRQQPEQAPALQPVTGSGAGTWMKNAAHRP